jgi:hypothetical protein
LVVVRVAYADGDTPAKVREALGASASDPELPLVVALDGGSLGIPPSSLATGLAAALDTHIDPRKIELAWSTFQNTSSTGFMELSNLELNKRWSIDVRIEEAEMRLPRIGLGDSALMRAVEAEQIDSVGLHMTHRAYGRVDTQWFGARVMRRTDSMFGGGVLEGGGRWHLQEWTLFVGVAATHLRPASNDTAQMPSFTNLRGVLGLQRSIASIVDAAGLYAVTSYGTWNDPFMAVRKSVPAFEVGAAVRASIHHLALAIAFHAYLPANDADSAQYGLSLITSAHQ